MVVYFVDKRMFPLEGELANEVLVDQLKNIKKEKGCQRKKAWRVREEDGKRVWWWLHYPFCLGHKRVVGLGRWGRLPAL